MFNKDFCLVLSLSCLCMCVSVILSLYLCLDVSMFMSLCYCLFASVCLISGNPTLVQGPPSPPGHTPGVGYRSLRQPGASNRISSRFIVAIGNLKSLVTSVNAENWSGLVTLRSSGLTVQDLLSKHVCLSNSQPPPSLPPVQSSRPQLSYSAPPHKYS